MLHHFFQDPVHHEVSHVCHIAHFLLQRKFLEALLPQDAPTTSSSGKAAAAGADTNNKLHSLRQIGWPLAPQDILSLIHSTASDLEGQNSYYIPVVIHDMFQNAQIVANWVQSCLEDGATWGNIEQFFVQVGRYEVV